MKNKVIFPLIVVEFGVACGGDDDEARRKNAAGYEVVQEGSASGVTSSIQGPGETLPPLTGTNADTTTAFSIDPNAAAAAPAPAQPAGTLAGTLPPPAYSTSQPQQVPSPRPMTSSASRPSYEPRQSQPVTRTPQPSQPFQPSQPVDPQPPATDTTATQPAPPRPQQPPAQATPPPTNQPPQPLPEPPKQEEEEEEEEEAPPPPTTTDTRGQ